MRDEITAQLHGSSGWQRVNCPACEERIGKADTKRSMSVAESGYYQCHRCSVKGWLENRERVYAPPVVETQETVELPQGCVKIDGSPASALIDAKRYLVKRLGPYAARVARDANLHACLSGRFANRIIAPYVSAGRLIGYQGRDWTNEHPAKYLNCKGMPRAFWNGDVLKSGISWVLVVEGVFDAFRYMPNVVACGGKPTDEQTQALTAFPGRVIVCLDPDASACAGAAWREAEALMMLMQLDGKSEQLISQILLPQGEDPGSIPVEWMRSEIRRCLAATPTC